MNRTLQCFHIDKRNHPNVERAHRDAHERESQKRAGAKRRALAACDALVLVPRVVDQRQNDHREHDTKYAQAQRERFNQLEILGGARHEKDIRQRCRTNQRAEARQVHDEQQRRPNVDGF